MEQPNQAAPAQQPGTEGRPSSKGAEALHRVTLAAMRIVYQPEMTEQLLAMMRNGEPAEAVAQATLTVLDGIKQQMRGINENFVYAAAGNVAAMLFEIAKTAGLFEFKPEMIMQAMQIMAQQLKGQGAAPAEQPPTEQPAQPAPTPGGGGLIQQAMGA